jgi:hypothetical protein
MAAQAVVVPEVPAAPEGGSDIFLIAMPLVTYRFISDEAMKRGMTFAQAMQQALNQWAGTQPTSK